MARSVQCSALGERAPFARQTVGWDARLLLLASRVLAPGLRQSELSVPSIHCGACIARIERLLGALPAVEQARANLSTKRVTIDWRGEHPPDLIATLGDAGFEAHLHDPAVDSGDDTTRELVRALAVAGFAAGNIMMLSVAVWSGLRTTHARATSPFIGWGTPATHASSTAGWVEITSSISRGQTW